MEQYVAIRFAEGDLGEALAIATNSLPKGSFSTDAPDGVLHFGPVEPSLWVDLAIATVPTVLGLVALWLGKGKTLRMVRRANGKEESIELGGHNDRTTTELAKAFLDKAR